MSSYRPKDRYYRPLVQKGPVRPAGARPLAGGQMWFTHAEVLERGAASRIIPADAIGARCLTALTAPRAPMAGLMMDQPRIMGILNVTPDSFSDGGAHNGAAMAAAHGMAMVEGGADFIDIGGESTRPGALEVPEEAEIARVEPAIRALSSQVETPISIDTRKASVAEVAVNAGAAMVNDVSGFVFDRELAPFCAHHHLPVCIMHSPATPDVMQTQSNYDNLLLDVFDFLGEQMALMESFGLPRARMVIDPGIGFGKDLKQNLCILNNLSLFHGHGVPLLVGASRKGFIRTIGKAEDARSRMPGSVAVALEAANQGAQILRVHDVAETKQALRLWEAMRDGGTYDT